MKKVMFYILFVIFLIIVLPIVFTKRFETEEVSKINPYDLYGIETALTLAEKYGGIVESITMGPPQSKAVIEETVCMGVSFSWTCVL